MNEYTITPQLLRRYWNNRHNQTFEISLFRDFAVHLPKGRQFEPVLRYLGI